MFLAKAGLTTWHVAFVIPRQTWHNFDLLQDEIYVEFLHRLANNRCTEHPNGLLMTRQSNNHFRHFPRPLPPQQVFFEGFDIVKSYPYSPVSTCPG